MECLMESVWLDFGFLRQDFWAHHVISISNHREPLHHSLHTQELPFYRPNTVFYMSNNGLFSSSGDGSSCAIVGGWDSSYGVVDNVPDCNIVVSEFKLQSCYYVHFWTNTLGKGINPLIPISIWVEKYHYSSTKMALVLNNPWKLISNKETETSSGEQYL